MSALLAFGVCSSRLCVSCCCVLFINSVYALVHMQGSTELWEWDSQLASEAFKLHDRVLRQYMTQFYGYEVSTEGDAFLVAFHEQFDAVAWCLCVQLALHCE